MGIFSGLFKSRDKPQNSTAGSGYRFYLGGTTSGKAVTERSAMQITAVYSGTDNLSGVAAVEYYRSEEILTEDEVSAIEDWTVYSSISETAEDAEQFIYYVKITD